jgi:DNA-binding response OmpR family regulator
MKGKTRILVVEDDTPLAMLMVHVLCRAGCDVEVAQTGQKGMELAREKKFDLIIVDLDLTGFEICHEIKQRHTSCRTPIIFISVHPGEEDRRRAVELGAVDYVVKQFEAQGFINRILACLKGPQRSAEVQVSSDKHSCQN